MIYAVVKDKTVGCPQCHEEYYVHRKLHDTVTRCSKCQCVYFIKPPGTPPYDPAADTDDIPASDDTNTMAPRPADRPRPRRTRDNIKLVKGDELTRTMPMQRGMGMRQRRSRKGVHANVHDLKHTMPLNRSGMSMRPKRSRRKAKEEDLKFTMPMRRGGMGMQPKPISVDELTLGETQEDTANEHLIAIATENDVGCPVCGTRSVITPEFYDRHAECMACQAVFEVKPPGTIVDMPPPALIGDLYSVAEKNDVACPQCAVRFEITDAYHNAAAQCEECGCVFVIKPPGTDPCRITLGEPLKPVKPQQPFKQSSFASIVTPADDTFRQKRRLTARPSPFSRILDIADELLPRSKGLYFGVVAVIGLLLTIVILLIILLIEVL